MNIMAKNKLQKFKELATFYNTIQPEKKDLLSDIFSIKVIGIRNLKIITLLF